MKSSRILRQKTIQVYERGDLCTSSDILVMEEYVQVFLNGHKVVSLACSPDSLEELAVGYLVNENYIRHPAELKNVAVDESGLCVRVELYNRVNSYVHVNSSKGYNTAGSNTPVYYTDSEVAFSAQHVLDLVNELDEASLTFKRTGGVHSAAIGDQSKMLARFEDISRHNAVDKIIGHAFLNQISLKNKCLVLSGRIASEILLKAAHNQIPIILSRSAPTLKSIEMAEDLGITVIGFARGQRFNLYTHSQRIVSV